MRARSQDAIEVRRNSRHYSEPKNSAPFFAAGKYGGADAIKEFRRRLVDLPVAINLDGFARGVEGNLAVLAAAKVFLEVSAHLGGYRVVDQIIEHRDKFSASHFSTPFPTDPDFLRK